MPETGQIGIGQTVEVAATEHEAIETLLLGTRVDLCDVFQKRRYFALHGQHFATAEVKDLQVRPQVTSDGKMRSKTISVHRYAGYVRDGGYPM